MVREAPAALSVDKIAEEAAGFGAKGPAWVAKRTVPWEVLLLSSFPPEDRGTAQEMSAEAGDLILFCCGRLPGDRCEILGRACLHMAKVLDKQEKVMISSGLLTSTVPLG